MASGHEPQIAGGRKRSCSFYLSKAVYRGLNSPIFMPKGFSANVHALFDDEIKS
ncbi:hypothetical protein [uncultured Campylobacter sp.]|uniref:hypothetical protein n=1 Tax=uncultured Campylobacter sp. TaxID=218934 RepID=UPI002611A9E7|nr:hypothetical protein [uncultured Campylobacter sp.]